MILIKCKSDHSGVPEFLCRVCHPELATKAEVIPSKFFAAEDSRSHPRRSPEDEVEIASFKEERSRRDKERAEVRAKDRAARAKEKKGYVPGATWDLRNSRWVHPTIQAQEAEETGQAFRLVILDRHPRASGSKAAARFDDMAAFLASNPAAKMADIYAGTSYTKTDFDWDLERGSVRKEYTKL